MNPIELSLFSQRINALCEEMGAVLRCTARSPNIKDRLDFSCAVFDAEGQLCAQAAHIPVHLGSMAFAMADIVGGQLWAEGDMLVVNDPYLGGTHLPDVTLIAPVFVDGELCAFVANRAHHADIGASSPGSMPIARRLEEEGNIIAPTMVQKGYQLDETRLAGIANSGEVDDFLAQISANQCGVKRLTALIEQSGPAFTEQLNALNEYAERISRQMLAEIPDGLYSFDEVMDGDGCGGENIPLRVAITIAGDTASLDFAGTAPQVAGNINCPLAVTAAGVFYVFRCLMPADSPACAGSFRPISLSVPEGTLLNARYPAAVAAGNVETSSRVVDLVLGALAQAIPARIPAASQGTMNNVAMGSNEGQRWNYYETIGGGMGASRRGPGLSGVQTHMTNTLNTPVESLETHYPLRLECYELRAGSGGEGEHRGGDGLIRQYRFLQPTQVTLLSERRRVSPWGLEGGLAGAVGVNRLNGKEVSGKCVLQVSTGDELQLQTPGGGGWGGSANRPELE